MIPQEFLNLRKTSVPNSSFSRIPGVVPIGTAPVEPPTLTPIPAAPLQQSFNPLAIGPLGWGPQLRQFASPATAQTQTPAENPFQQVDPGNYASPTRGTSRFGVGFGRGLGGDAQTQRLFGKAPDMAGLWAMGFDQTDPNFNRKLWAFHQDKMRTDADYKNYVTKEAAKNGWNLNDIQGMTYGADWYYRDLARRMGQSNNFLDSPLGKILSTVAQVGLGTLPMPGAPLLSAGLGAYTGQRKGGGVLGGLLGAATGYGAGKLGSNIATNGLGNTINSGINSVKNLFGGGELTSINQYFPADIQARGITSASLLPVGAATRLLQPNLHRLLSNTRSNNTEPTIREIVNSLKTSVPKTENSVYRIPGVVPIGTAPFGPPTLTPIPLHRDPIVIELLKQTPLRPLKGARNIKAHKPYLPFLQLESPLHKKNRRFFNDMGSRYSSDIAQELRRRILSKPTDRKYL